ncbi:helix-turn-helix domain-containing protein [Pseudomonas flavocrustae]
MIFCRSFLEIRMVKCHLSRLLGERKLKISDVVRDTGINRGTLTRLYHETAQRVELKDLEAICQYLNCQVGDLLELQDDPEG